MADSTPEWLKVGSKVLVKDRGLEGTVRFLGETNFAPGLWAGVELDEQKGKNDGTVKGKSYFSCEEGYGLMVRYHQLDPIDSGGLVATPTTSSPESWIRPGLRVLVKDKNLEGTIRFFGNTEFAPGKWVGVELDDPKGKNNGSVKDKVYFECREKHGLMVRSLQIESLGDVPSSTLVPKKRLGGTKSPITGSSPGAKRSQLAKPSPRSGSGHTTPGSTPSSTSPKVPHKATPKDEESPLPPPLPLVSAESGGTDPVVLDLQQKLSILQQKRAEDKTKIKELEKYRMQYQQMVEYKAKWTESQSDLQQQLKQAKKEARDAQLTKEQVEDELRELSDAVEIATLDKEMAEEKCEGLLAENEALKEQIQELSMDLEILQNEISESGYEGAAASGQLKQLEQQNNRLKEALMRLRDVSNEEKSEHQLLLRDFEKQTQVLSQTNEQKSRLEEELKGAEEFIATLKEQVDIAMGAEEMVEKLTEQNLKLEEDIVQLNEAVSDLEALRELSEQQEEIKIEEEHELREELDMNMNNIRQLEQKLDASQETIVDQQKTIDKFRDLVRHLQTDLTELRKQPKEEQGEVESTPSIVSSETMLSQIKTSAVQAYSRTIDYELRKLESQQSSEIINYFKSFLPNSFLVSGGDYDAVNVIMLLPRIVFKAELIIDQLKQQTGIDEALSSPSTAPPNRLDLQTFASFLIYKLTTLWQLVNVVIRILTECDVPLYRQVGGIRDDLALHERALNILIELLRKEQLDEAVPLNGVEKAIKHFESLLENRLKFSPKGRVMDLFQDNVRVVTNGCNYMTLELTRLHNMSKNASGFLSVLKELESFNNDIRQTCRKARRRLPTPQSGKIILLPDDLFPSLIKNQALLVTNFRALYSRVHHKNQGLADNESLSNAELEVLFNEMAKVVFQGVMIEEAGGDSIPHSCMSKMAKDLEHFLTELQNGTYDSQDPKLKFTPPITLRAQVVKDELSDTEGLRYKIEEKNNEIKELKKDLKLKLQEIGEINTKVALLEKKLEQAGAECTRKVEEEKMETERMKTILDQQEEKFNRAIVVLQKDIEGLEEERDTLKQQLESQSRSPMPQDLPRRTSSLSGRQALATLMGSRSPAHAHRSQATPPQPSTAASDDTAGPFPPISNSPLLLAQIDSLKKALCYSQDENVHLKAQAVRAKLSSLPRLHVASTLSVDRKRRREGGEETNRSDTEKSFTRRTDNLLKDLNTALSHACVVDITKKERDVGAREALAQRMSSLIELKHKTALLKEEAAQSLASSYSRGLVQTRIKSFVSPSFSKALSENDASCKQLLAKLYLPGSSGREEGELASGRACKKLLLSASQFQALHSLVVT
ncbi:PREDICTED: dynactin subunit 1-like [Amphimedon queenslandica]|uniref:Dynactin subunit 1 n=2 Tax=Amphimedon queenslandica TaxID=400682 RepID=A0AAN0IBL2_AMPQE|nr:PREDICTED: dynactin subunit 1-like [Amphimedon queenslandica]|eukprot:XP_003384705.1 PREDICTED: dynactin subunit 1-like [Amphimedon queenslandica]